MNITYDYGRPTGITLEKLNFRQGFTKDLVKPGAPYLVYGYNGAYPTIIYFTYRGEVDELGLGDSNEVSPDWWMVELPDCITPKQ